MADWLEERFIEATPRRTRQACEEGRVPRSRELMATMVLTTCFGMVIWRGPQTFVKLQDTLRQRLSAPPWSRLHSEEVVAEFIGLLGQVFLVVFPFLLGLVSCAIALGILQSGWLWLPNRVLPDPGRVNPLRGAAKTVFGSSPGGIAGRYGQNAVDSRSLRVELLATSGCPVVSFVLRRLGWLRSDVRRHLTMLR